MAVLVKAGGLKYVLYLRTLWYVQGFFRSLGDESRVACTILLSLEQ